MTSTGEVWKLGHRPALDGIRGIAVLLVVLCHTVAWRIAGTVGVAMFFTLSGFLITALLLEERGRAGRVSLRGFWWRRAIRLLPALGLVLLVVGYVDWQTSSGGAGRIAGVVFYCTNWAAAFGGSQGMFMHAWSLSVEEQFYIVWPLVFVLAMRRWGQRGVLAVSLTGALAVAAWRAALWMSGASGVRVYVGTDTRADALLIGCALAAWMVGRPPTVPRRPGLAGLLLTVLIAASPIGSDFAYYVAAPTVVPVLTAAMLWLASTRPVPSLTMRPLRAVGRLSYGIYLWHFPLAVTINEYLQPEHRVWWLAATVPVAFGLAGLSWRYVEQPAQRWARQVTRKKSKMASACTPAPADSDDAKIPMWVGV